VHFQAWFLGIVVNSLASGSQTPNPIPDPPR
jgi:hypothetical protein